MLTVGPAVQQGGGLCGSGRSSGEHGVVLNEARRMHPHLRDRVVGVVVLYPHASQRAPSNYRGLTGKDGDRCGSSRSADSSANQRACPTAGDANFVLTIFQKNMQRIPTKQAAAAAEVLFT